MNKKSTVNCSECGAEVPNSLDLCPQCGIEVDEANPTQTEVSQEQFSDVDELEQERPTGASKRTSQSGEGDGMEKSESSTPDQGTNGTPEETHTGATENAKIRPGSRFGFAAVIGAFGGVFLLAPVFLIGPEAFAFLFGGSKKGMAVAPYRAGMAVATAVTIAGGSLCLLAAALRIAGVGFDISKVAGALGMLGGGIGIIMMFVV